MITKSAEKAHRQNLRRQKRNLAKKTALKKVLKNYKKLLVAGDLDAAKTELPNVYKALDKTAKTNVIAKNKAARLKSRLSKLLTTKR